MTAFLIWCAFAAFFVGLGVYCFFAGKPVGFWANAETFPVSDVRGYNRACGWLWTAYGLVLALLGTPLLAGQNNALILFSILGVVAENLVMILVYVLVIEKKYRKK